MNNETIESMIYVVRGEKVMLDFELAKIYGYETRAFNQQVNRNIEKFPSDFMFKLTRREANLILMSQNVISGWGGSRKLPYVFTDNKGKNNLNPNFIDDFISDTGLTKYSKKSPILI